MISFNLKCDLDHEFEGWFKSGEDFDKQQSSKKVVCPLCGSGKIEKALMAPNVAKGSVQAVASKADKAAKTGMAFAEMATKIREHVETNFDNVGKEFASEARRIHEGTADERGIYGEATGEEVKDLIEEKIDVMPLPDVPKKIDKKKLN